MHTLIVSLHYCHTQVRFVAADDIWLSPQTSLNPVQTPTCAITLTIYADRKTADDYFNACYEEIAKLNIGYRFHWGKHFPADTDSVDLQEMYPKFEDFAEIRNALDPKGVFLNPFLEDTFGFDDE